MAVGGVAARRTVDIGHITSVGAIRKVNGDGVIIQITAKPSLPNVVRQVNGVYRLSGDVLIENTIIVVQPSIPLKSPENKNAVAGHSIPNSRIRLSRKHIYVIDNFGVTRFTGINGQAKCTVITTIGIKRGTCCPIFFTHPIIILVLPFQQHIWLLSGGEIDNWQIVERGLADVRKFNADVVVGITLLNKIAANFYRVGNTKAYSAGRDRQSVLASPECPLGQLTNWEWYKHRCYCPQAPNNLAPGK